MVNVAEKAPGLRIATASARVEVGESALQLIASRRMPKGDVFAAARIAGIMAAKKTSELIPLCHPLAIEGIEVEITPEPPFCVLITAAVRITGKTGVEMEALTAVSVAALTIYDMCKSVTKDISIGPIQLETKTGGKSGGYSRKKSNRR
jgi:cyclic pyranopterin phosphate synthase